MTPLLVVFEGPDGSGKSTLMGAVRSRLMRDKSPVESLAFPTHNGAVGRLIRQVYSNEVQVYEPAMLHLLVADQIDHEPMVHGWLLTGNDVLFDRHVPVSSWVYQTEHHSLQRHQAVVQPESLQTPDLLFLLDVPEATLQQRLKARSELNPRYESLDTDRIAQQKARYMAYCVMHGGVVLDGERPVQHNVEVVLQHMQAARVAKEAKAHE